MNATIYKNLPCPTCGRLYSRNLEELLASACCGRPLPAVELAPAPNFGPTPFAAALPIFHALRSLGPAAAQPERDENGN